MLGGGASSLTQQLAAVRQNWTRYAHGGATLTATSQTLPYTTSYATYEITASGQLMNQSSFIFLSLIIRQSHCAEMSVTGMEYPSTLPGNLAESRRDSLFTILKLSVYVCMYCMFVANMVK